MASRYVAPQHVSEIRDEFLKSLRSARQHVDHGAELGRIGSRSRLEVAQLGFRASEPLRNSRVPFEPHGGDRLDQVVAFFRQLLQSRIVSATVGAPRRPTFAQDAARTLLKHVERFLDVGGRDEVALNGLQQPRFDDLPLDAKVVRARVLAAVGMARADVRLRRPGDGEARAAHGALQQTREGVLRSTAVAAHVRNCQPVADVSADLFRALALARLHAVPERLRHDAQLGNGERHQLVGRSANGDGLFRFGILDSTAAIPYAHAAIEVVVEDADASARVARDGGREPLAVSAARLAPPHGAGGGRAPSVQLVGDSSRAPACCVQLEDLAHDGGVLLDDQQTRARDLALLVDDGLAPVAVGAPSDREPVPRPTLKAAVRLVPDHIHVLGVH